MQLLSVGRTWGHVQLSRVVVNSPSSIRASMHGVGFRRRMTSFPKAPSLTGGCAGEPRKDSSSAAWHTGTLTRFDRRVSSYGLVVLKCKGRHEDSLQAEI